MAQRSFNQRFPMFKWILFLAVVLSLPLTVFSVNNVSTNTSQEAAGATCTSHWGSCYKYECPRGTKSIDGTCGGVRDSACCSAYPAGLKSSYTACKKFGETFTARISLSWNTLSGAASYRVYWYDTVGGRVIGSDSKSVTSTSTVIEPSISTGGRFYWYVKGYNSTKKIYSPASETKEITFSCNKL